MKVAHFAVGYGVCVLIGWLLAQSSTPAASESDPVGKAARATSGKSPGMRILEDQMAFPEELKAKKKEIHDKFSGELPPTDDPGGAFLALLHAQGETLEKLIQSGAITDPRTDPQFVALGLRFQQWFEEDPVAAVKALASIEEQALSEQLRSNYFWPQIYGRLSEDGIEASLPWIETAWEIPGRPISTILFQHLGMFNKVEDVIFLKKMHPGWFEPSVHIQLLAGGWSFENREELLDALDEKHQANAILMFARGADPTEGLDWVLSILADEGTPAGVRSSLGSDYNLAHLIQNSTHPLARRVELMNTYFRNFRGMDDHAAQSQVIYHNLMGYFRDGFQKKGDDVRYDVRHGKLPAQDLYARLLDEFPPMQTKAGELRSQLFRFLAEDNLEQALTLYDDPQAQDWQKIYAARWWFRDTNPNDFAAMIDSIELDFGDPGVAHALQEGWRSKTGMNLARFGSDYLAWVEALPDGPNRTWALEAIADQGASDNAHLADRAKELLREP